jgi:tetratricopeptide (TPR) repeat protein
LVGTNVVTYDTPVSNIVAFVEKSYLQRDFSGFRGDRKFMRDDQAQKAFSKLRSSIGGIYAWRVSNSKSPAEQQRMLKEADFAFRQSFAFCPYSPEAVHRYAQLLLNTGRYDDALMIATVSQKLDPYNGSFIGLVNAITEIRKQRQGMPSQAQMNIQQVEADYAAHPTNFQAAFNLASLYVQMQQTNRAVQILDQVLNHPQVDVNAILAIAQGYAQMGNFPKLEATLDKLVKVAPDNAEAWYDLAALKAAISKQTEAIAALQRALDLNAKRLSTDPQARNLMTNAIADPRFNSLRQKPEFQQLLGTHQLTAPK